MKRRDLLKYISITPLAGASIVGGITSANATPLAVAAGRDLFAELGVRTFINAAGTYTAMTATLMRPATVEAIRQASHISGGNKRRICSINFRNGRNFNWIRSC